MTTIVEEFIESPSCELLEQCTKEQLLKLAQHYTLVVDARRAKDTIMSIVKTNLQEQGVLKTELGKSDISTSLSGLTFEQPKELLMMKLEHEQQLERMKYKTEQMKMEVEQQKLELMKAGVLPAAASKEGETVNYFDVIKNLRLVPKFDEKDVETFFSTV